jgi:hypothetical protein
VVERVFYGITAAQQVAAAAFGSTMPAPNCCAKGPAPLVGVRVVFAVAFSRARAFTELARAV